MRTLAGIIVVITLLAIGMVVFFMYFMPVEWQITLILLIIRTQALVRGVMIELLWQITVVIITIAVGYLLMAGHKLLASGVGAIVVAAFIAAVISIILGMMNSIQWAIPWYDIKVPTLELGGDNGISTLTLEQKLVDLTLDCWSAYQANKYDPLAGVPGYHPRRCATIYFNLDSSADMGAVYQSVASYVLPSSNAIEVKGTLGERYKVYRSWQKVLGYVKVVQEGTSYRIYLERDDCEDNYLCNQLPCTTQLCGIKLNLIEYDGQYYRLILGDVTTVGDKLNLQEAFFEGSCRQGYIYVEYGDCSWAISIPAGTTTYTFGPGHDWSSPVCNINGPEDVSDYCANGDFVILCLECTG